MADDFDQLASTLLEGLSIQTDTKLSELCGASFRGFLTPFDDLFVVHDWMIKTKQLTAGDDRIDRRIRKVLLVDRI